MTAEKEGLTAAGITAPPDPMPQLTDEGRQTGSGRAELTAGKDGIHLGLSAVTGIGIVTTGRAGKTDTEAATDMLRTSITVETGMCPAIEQTGPGMIAGNKTETDTGQRLLRHLCAVVALLSPALHVHNVLWIQAWAVASCPCICLVALHSCVL